MKRIICRICKVPKSVSEFWEQPKNSSGYETGCKQCRMLRQYERRRERRLEQGLLVKFPTLAGRQLAEEGKKYCPTCKQVKNLSEFSTMKTRSGVASHCKKCTSEWGKKYGKTNEGRQKRKALYQKHKEKQLDQKMRKKFGISLQEYEVMLDKQGRKCMICGRTPEENGKALAIDHDHKTGKNRALLCSSCNICIGFIEKNALNISKIATYLTTHNIQPRQSQLD